MPAAARSPQCPNDDGALRPVQAHSRQGAAVMLDQCDHCGGVWFDRFELFQVDEADACSLDKVEKASLRFPRGSNDKPLCPRCREPLRAFSDPNIPANIQLLLICDACEGFWVNHGDVAGYAEFRERGRKRPDPRLAAEYEKMLKAQSDKQYWQGIGSFGSALGAPRDMLTGLSLQGSPAELERIDRGQDAFFTVLGIAARLLFSWL